MLGRRRFSCTFLPFLGFASLAGCGLGTVAIGAAAGNDDSSNSPTTVGAVSVSDAKQAPATVSFVLTDPENDPATARIRFIPPGGALADAADAALVGSPTLTDLSTDRDGVLHDEFEWDYASQVPTGEQFAEGYVLFVTVQDQAEPDLETNATEVDLGNDPPEVMVAADGFAAGEVPLEEVAGLVHVTFVVLDSSADQVDIDVEYAIVDGLDLEAGERPVEEDFGPATSEGEPLSAVQVDQQGTTIDFFWDVLDDLGSTEHDVLLRLTPDDGTLRGTPRLTRSFSIDNNAAPLPLPDFAALVFNPDGRRGIPLPFRVADPESDPVRIVFQWRRADESFPPLPGVEQAGGASELLSIVDDPEERARHQLASEMALGFEGHTAPTLAPDPDGTRVRIPELAIGSLHSLAASLVGEELQILRAAALPEPLAAGWADNPLRGPVAALPLGAGANALVLDGRDTGSWRLREIELASGALVREIATASGDPDAMVYEEGAGSVLVASSLGELWQLERVELEGPGPPAPMLLVAADGSTELGRVRGLAHLASDSALITVGSSLIRLDYPAGGAPGTRAIFGPPPLLPLDTPWGVVADPLQSERIYVVENGAERVLAIELDSLQVREVRASGLGLPGPEALSLERSGARLVVVVHPPDGNRALRGVEVGGGSAGEVFAIFPAEGAPDYTGTIGCPTAGPDGLRLVPLTSGDDLAVGGGLEQSRTITAYERADQVVVVDRAFQPRLDAGSPLLASTRRWRVLRRLEETLPTAPLAGPAGVFLWDSRGIAGDLALRMIAVDTDVGLPSVAVPKKVRTPFESVELGSPPTTERPDSVDVGDLDGDGDLDIVAANRTLHTVTVFFQATPGGFPAVPDLVLGGSETTRVPRSVKTADIDSDGDLDLLTVNRANATLTIFYQALPGQFPTIPDDSLQPGEFPAASAVADLDGDGDLDLVSASIFGSDHLAVFLQEPAGQFPQTPDSVLATPPNPISIATGDLDQDGDIDLATANTNGDNLSLFFQQSPGRFQEPPVLLGDATTTGFARSIASADLDLDGDLDLVSSNAISSSLTVFRQAEPGQFNASPDLTLPTLQEPGDLVAADIDGDGHLDLSAANPVNDVVEVFLQAGTGEFPLVSDFLLPATTTLAGLTSLVAADIEGDGDLDILAGGAFQDRMTLFFQASASQLLMASEVTLGPVAAADAPYFTAPADLDGDGDLDLLSANAFSSTLTIFFQTAPGLFPERPDVVLQIPGDLPHPTVVVPADLDADGDLDLVTSDYLTDTLSVFFQSSPGQFSATPDLALLLSDSFSEGPRFVAAADLDGDGDLDLVSANEFSGRLMTFLQSAPGVFPDVPDQTLGSFETTGGAASVLAADLDGDGALELVSANASSDSLAIFFQVSPGVFPELPDLSLGSPATTNGPLSVAAADLDADGDLDLVSANVGSDNLAIFFQVGPGQFSPTPDLLLGSPSTTDGPVSVVVHDIDGDGDLDLAAANERGNSVTVFFQSAPGRFPLAPDLTFGGPESTPFPEAVAIADLDGDGDPDLISSNSGNNTLSIFFGGH